MHAKKSKHNVSEKSDWLRQYPIAKLGILEITKVYTHKNSECKRYLETIVFHKNDHIKKLVLNEGKIWDRSFLVAPGPVLQCISDKDISV